MNECDDNEYRFMYINQCDHRRTKLKIIKIRQCLISFIHKCTSFLSSVVDVSNKHFFFVDKKELFWKDNHNIHLRLLNVTTQSIIDSSSSPSSLNS